MNMSELYNQLNQLFHQYHLGILDKEPEILTGGLLHKIYKVSSGDKVYAVKWLNPSIMKREGVLYNMIQSEIIAKEVAKHLPAIASIDVCGQQVLESSGEYYIIFDWAEGTSIYPPNITEDNCYQIGLFLGKLHSLNISIPAIQKESNADSIINWNYYLKIGKQEKVNQDKNNQDIDNQDIENQVKNNQDINNQDKIKYLDIYSKAIHKLSTWSYQANEAIQGLSENQVISHRDLDPKNVLWFNNTPYTIDWEAAGYINPYQELLEVLNYWTEDGAGHLCEDKFASLLDGYQENMDLKKVEWDIILNSGYNSMLGWLEYSLKRSFGMEVNEEAERKIGREQVIITIDSLYQYERNIPIIKKWLESVR